MQFFNLPSMPTTWAEKPYSILNDRYPRPAANVDGFAAFTRLPADLRIRVWEESLASSHLISIEVYQDEERDEARALYTTRNKLERTISNYPYQLQLERSSFERTRIKYALFWVNREANRAFLAHYRVRLPIASPCATHPQDLLYNPEYDTLNIQLRSRTPAVALIALLHDAIAYDPKEVGIAHLALSHTEIAELALLPPSVREDVPGSSIARLFTRSLRSLRLVVPLSIASRNMLGKMSWPHGDIHQNRSIPISGDLLRTHVTAFSLLESDPRPIEKDLSHVAVGTDPRRCLYLWYQFVSRHLGLKYEQQLSGVDVCYLLSISPGPVSSSDYPALQSRNGFVDFVRGLDYRWADWMRKLNLPPWGKRLSEEGNRALESGFEDGTGNCTGLEPVAGFWLFPAHAFGNVDEFCQRVDDQYLPVTTEIEWKPKLVMDLSQFQPQLGIFELL